MRPANSLPRWPRGAAASFALAAAGLLSACAINPSLRVAESLPQQTPLVLGNVPFHPQSEYQCGPAALAMVLGASGVAVTPLELVPQVYLPGREGSLQLELVAATRRAGRIPYVVESTPDALFAQLRAGHPVLVLQNLLVRTVPRWHYAVLIGADPVRNRMILHSGTRRALQMPAPEFLRTWDWAGRWGMVALRPGELPARAEPSAYLAAVADFEAVAGAQAATPAYRAALERWPQEPDVHLALGNQAYAAGKRVQAAHHYRDGLALAPGDVVLGNNYASVLGELGCGVQAHRALRRAESGLQADGRWRGELQRTAAEIADAGNGGDCAAFSEIPAGEP